MNRLTRHPFCLALWLLGVGTCFADAVLHVSPRGRDSWPGTEQQPVRTLGRARDRLRTLRRDRRARATVWVHEGDYHLEAAFELGAKDGGSPDAPVLYRAEDAVSLVGGERVPPERVRPVTDAALLARLPESSRDRVVALDLRRLADAGRLGALPDLWRDPPGLTELSWNGQILRLARWPNRDWTTVTEVVSERPPVIRFSGDRPSRWDIESGVWLHGYWFYEWIDETVRIARVDVEAKHIELAVRPPYHGISSDSRSCLRRFRAINVLEELDEPGEYWIDPAQGIALLLPPTSGNRARIVVSTLKDPIVRLTGCSHVELRGFVVESGRGDGIVVQGGTGNTIAECEVRNVGGMGIRVTGAKHSVRSCDVHHTGDTAVDLRGGDRVHLEPAGNSVTNCDIHHPGRIKQTYSPGIRLSGCGQTARHNRVHDGPHIGILFAGNDQVIERNEIDHLCTDSGDVAAIYSANSPGFRGTLIRHNFVHHIPLNVRYGAIGVYLDNALCGNVVSGNVFYRACDPSSKASTFAALYVHHGYQNLVANNLFVECGRAVGARVYGDRKWSHYKGAMLKRDKDGAAGLATDEWLAAYRNRPLPGYGLEEFLAWKHPDHCPKRLNPVERNLVVHCDADFGRGLAARDNVVTDDLAWLENPSAGDLRLRRTDALPPGFEPIPFEDMGLRRDDVRRRVPARRWCTQPPIAHAGLNRVVFDRDRDGVETVALDASRSRDPDGGELRSFLWLIERREIARGTSAAAELPLGEHRIILRAMDRDGYWSTDDVRVAVLSAAREAELGGAPAGLIALPDRYRAKVGTSLTVSSEEGVLANDAELDQPRRVELMTTTQHGRLECLPDGAFRYAPDPGWSGVDQFRYRIRVGEQFSNSVTVEVGVGYCRGFVWDRSAEWTPGSSVGKPNGNPDDDAMGQPVWFYGSTADRGQRWFAATPLRHVWDREWCSQTGNSCWVRADDRGPFFRPTVVFQTDSTHSPVIRWHNPTGRRLRLRVAGDITVAWSLTPKPGTRTTVVVAKEHNGKEEVAFQKTSTGKPKERATHALDVTVDVEPDGVLILGSRTEDTGRGWVTTTDDLAFTIVEIDE